MDGKTIQGGAMYQATQDALGLFASINKVDGSVDNQYTPLDQYKSSLDTEEIMKLVAAWHREYTTYDLMIKRDQEVSLKYWLGKQKLDMTGISSEYDTVVNKLFEAIETFLPIACRANPEPLVSAGRDPEAQQLAKDLKNALVYEAEQTKLRRKLARMTRHWLLFLLGCIQIDFDPITEQIKLIVIDPRKLVLDKNGTIDENGYFTGDYIGLKKKTRVSDLIELFPDHKDYIAECVKDKLDTEVDYMQWWYKGTDLFYTLKYRVLGKFKNPHWNYDDDEVEGINHLDKPMAPFVFLSVFSIGNRPHDETSLILQNISQQNQINKRYRQLDYNIDRQNNGMVVNGLLLDNEQAAQAAYALAKGMAVRVNADPRTAVMNNQAPSLSGDVWNSVNKAEENLSTIFGVSGSTPDSVKNTQTARGKILINQLDASRIGGGVTEYIEQVACSIYDWMVQMMIVHYDTEHYVDMLGISAGASLQPIVNSRMTKRVNISVKEGSLIPHDPLTERNEAVDLWSQGAIDPQTLFTKLDYPDPAQATQALMLWQLYSKGAIPPEAYLPSFQVNAQGQAQGAIPPPRGVGDEDLNAPTGQDMNPPPEQDAGLSDEVRQEGTQLLNTIPMQ